MAKVDEVWTDEDLVAGYLDGVRKATPMAEEEIEVMMHLIRLTIPNKVRVFLDLGCGDGALGRPILKEYPQAKAVFLDFSDTMLNAARKEVAHSNGKVFFIKEDFSKRSWVKSAAGYGKFDVIVSGNAIHHQTDKRKKEIYKEIFDLLAPGGLFLNSEHVAYPSKWLEKAFDEYFVDSLYKYHRAYNPKQRRSSIAKDYYGSPGSEADLLAPLDKQCSWLQAIGFIEVDCYLKIFSLAMFGGIKPRRKS